MRRILAALWAAAATAAAALPAIAQIHGEYELVSHDRDTLPAAVEQFTIHRGILVIRPDSGFIRRVTLSQRTAAGEERWGTRKASGAYRDLDDQLAMVTSGGDWDGIWFFTPPGGDGILRVRDSRGGSEYRRVKSAPWADGTYEATHWEGIPLPASRGRSEIAEFTGKTLVLSGGRYRSELRFRRSNGTSETSVGEGSYTVEGQELVMRMDDPNGPGNSFRQHWSRGRDGTLRITARDGETWEYRPGPRR